VFGAGLTAVILRHGPDARGRLPQVIGGMLAAMTGVVRLVDDR
jgi:hypothetical protein